MAKKAASRGVKKAAPKVGRAPPRKAAGRRRKRLSKQELYVLSLYITGTTPRSSRAVENILRICKEHLEGNYELRIIDLYQQPKLAAGDSVIAAPTLVKHMPSPLRRLVGDMTNEERVLNGLNLRRASP